MKYSAIVMVDGVKVAEFKVSRDSSEWDMQLWNGMWGSAQQVGAVLLEREDEYLNSLAGFEQPVTYESFRCRRFQPNASPLRGGHLISALAWSTIGPCQCVRSPIMRLRTGKIDPRGSTWGVFCYRKSYFHR